MNRKPPDNSVQNGDSLNTGATKSGNNGHQKSNVPQQEPPSGRTPIQQTPMDDTNQHEAHSAVDDTPCALINANSSHPLDGSCTANGQIPTNGKKEDKQSDIVNSHHNTSLTLLTIAHNSGHPLDDSQPEKELLQGKDPSTPTENIDDSDPNKNGSIAESLNVPTTPESLAIFNAYIGIKDVQAVDIEISNYYSNTYRKISMNSDKDLKSVWFADIVVSEQEMQNGYLSYRYVVGTRTSGYFSTSEKVHEEMAFKKLERSINVNIVYNPDQAKFPIFLTGWTCLLKGLLYPTINEENFVLYQNCMSELYTDLIGSSFAKNAQKKDFFKVIEDLLSENESSPYQNAILLFCIRRFTFLAGIPNYELTQYLDGEMLRKLASNLFQVKADHFPFSAKEGLLYGVIDILLATERFWDSVSVLAILYPVLQTEDIERKRSHWFSRDHSLYFPEVKLLVKRASQFGHMSEHQCLFEKLIVESPTLSLALEVYSYIFGSATDFSATEQNCLNQVVIDYFVKNIKFHSRYSLTHLLNIGEDVLNLRVPSVKTALLTSVVKLFWNKLKLVLNVNKDSFVQFLKLVDELLNLDNEGNHKFVISMFEKIGVMKYLNKHFGNFAKFRFIQDAVEYIGLDRQKNLFIKWLKALSQDVLYSGNRRQRILEIIFNGALMVIENVCFEQNTFHAMCEATKELCKSNKFTLKEFISILPMLTISEKFQFVYKECISCFLEGKVLKETNTLQFIIDSSSSYKNKPEARLLLEDILDMILCKLAIPYIVGTHKPGRTVPNLKAMLDDCSRWLSVFQLTLESAKFKGNKILHAVKNKYLSVAEQFKANAVVYSDAQKIENELRWKSSGLNKLLKFFKVNFEDDDKISLDELSATFKNVEDLLIFCEHICSSLKVTLSDLKDKNVVLATRKSKWNEYTVMELLSDDFWLPLKNVRDKAPKILPVQASKSFKNVCLEVLKNKLNSNSTINEVSIDETVELFSGQALELFIEETGTFLRGGDIKLKCMKKLFMGTLDNFDDFENELKILACIHKIKIIDNTLIQKCRNFLNVKGLKDVIQPLLELMEFWKVTHEEADPLWLHMKSLMAPLEDIDNWSLEEANKISEEINKIVHCVGTHFGDIIEVLSESKELISFLQEVIDEDIRNLIDAVEEHSDQYVREATVSDLIDVHGCLKRLIKCISCDFKNFLEEIEKLCNGEVEPILVKIKECRAHVHSLRALYLNVANRGEMTMEIIANAVKQGRFVFQADGSSQSDCEITMSYERQDQTVIYKKDDIQDLRSRALLLINTDIDSGSDTNTQAKQISLEAFIEQAGLVIDITMVVNRLRKSGHFKYREFWESTSSIEELRILNIRLQNEIEVWTDCLEDARTKYYYLNYFYGEQLWTLFDFFRNKNSDFDRSLVLTMFRYVFSNFNLPSVSDLNCNLQLSSEKPTDLIFEIGAALEKVFEPFQQQRREFKTDVHASLIQAIVRPGEVFVAGLEENSTETANVILSLYKNTTGLYPGADQILFCTRRTSWEEVYLLLLRSFYAPVNGREGLLYCIANLEALDNEIQFKMVDTLRVLRQKSLQFDKQSRPLPLLALVCRGAFADLIGEQVSTKCYQVVGVSDIEAAECFREMQENVCLVTSAVSGLGKSEFVYADAAKKGLRPITVNISGPMTKADIVHKVSSAPMTKYNCLHINVAEIKDRDALDDFLFQILITGAIVVGTQIYIIPSKHIYIEIANTTNNWLFDTLSTTKYLMFSRHNLCWKNYSQLVVSQEVGSPLQIVCHYLNVFDKGSLDASEPMSNNSNPLPSSRCQYLLQKYFPAPSSNLSYSTVNTFLNVLSEQLKKMSSSTFFEVKNLQLMLGKEQHDVRSKLFQTLMDVSRAFASHAVAHSGESQTLPMTREDISVVINKMKESAAFSAAQFVQQMQCMIRWEDDNHLIVVFHAASSDSLTALYRDSSLVSPKVKSLLTSQKVKAGALDEFHKMSQDELLLKLKLIACEDHTSLMMQKTLSQSYALTPDNILKMALIILRVRARIPVVIVGETGCGKTSLVRFLAQVCKVNFRIFNFHAGIKEVEIINFIETAVKDAKKLGKQKFWIFLDEINTCDHIGLLSDIICRRQLGTISLPPNLILLAACNPYRLRDDSQILTTGLQMQDARAQVLVKDEYSCLVYRVHPLPESLTNYVWDYGSLGAKDEKAYIERMMNEVPFEKDQIKLMVELLFNSHEFLRQIEKNPFCVSLRDVNRYKILVQWFHNTILKRPALREDRLSSDAKTALEFDEATRAIILALAHCYQSRLSDQRSRVEYRKKMVSIFKMFNLAHRKCPGIIEGNYDQFDSIVRAEQEDYLCRMEIPEGIAKNGALLENVFVLLVCILNRIPVFVVGKPGSSKSLAMQLIRSNLRGHDSQDKYFKSLPQLYIVSYQGSEASTSDGIQKVFHKAMKYKEHTKQAEVLPVVLLDEIGLAEISSHNPLKVLHGLLEPAKGDLPEVAVVGISNWALDPAKMNRAIYLSRPEPDEEDLYQTGVSIFSTECEKQVSHKVIQMYLRNVAEAYNEYYTAQPFLNFHGLRDYYSLVKCLAKISAQIFSASKLEDDFKSLIRQSIDRNFGGIPKESQKIGDLFIEKSFISEDGSTQDSEIVEIPIEDLIKDNLLDKESRHLMLITKGDSAIGILQQILENSDRDFVSICGSRFEEDISEDYNYRMLSRIILHMERPCVLILKDLDEIYGSLYDMLNKNYIQVGKRKNCRVALGPFSNPMCHVHDDFRCVVIVEEEKVPYSDPPFLNRFEKQILRYSDVLNANQEQAINKLMSWIMSVSHIQDYTKIFNERSLFVGYHEETLPSLVLWHSKADPGVDEEVLLERCRENLLQIATTDGIMRLKRSDLGRECPEEVENIVSAYFDLPIHSGLNFLLHNLLDKNRNTTIKPEVDLKGFQLLVLTHSNFYTNLVDFVEEFSCQIEKLGAFKSERQLTKKVDDFFASSNELFILQCDLIKDIDNILLAKSVIENQRMRYLQLGQGVKHACIILHVQRQEDQEAAALNAFPGNFLCGWTQVHLDSIETPRVPVFDLLHSRELDLLFKATTSENIFKDQLLWAFSCLKYCGQQRSIDDMMKLVNHSLDSPKIVGTFRQIAEEWISLTETQTSKYLLTWQELCAFSKRKLLTHRTYISVLENHIFDLEKKPITMLVYRIEQNSLWPHRNFDDEALSFWTSVVTDSEVLKLNELPCPVGLECYPVSGRLHDLKFPCSMVFIKRMEDHKMLFKEAVSSHINDCNVGDLLDLIHTCPMETEELLAKFTRIVSQTLADVIASPVFHQMENEFIEDVLDVFTSHLPSTSSREDRIDVLNYFICSLFDEFECKDIQQKLATWYALMWNQGELLTSLVSLVSAYKEHPIGKFVSNGFLQGLLPTSEENPVAKRVNEAYFEDWKQQDLLPAVASLVDAYKKCPILKTDAIKYHGNLPSDEQSDQTKISEDLEDSKEHLQTVSEELNDGETDQEELQEVPTFEFLVVSLITRAMLPTKTVIDSFQNWEYWQRHSRRIMNIALKVDPSPPSFHFLRLCIDFLNILAKQPNFKLDLLFTLADLGTDSGGSSMESETVLEFILEAKTTLETQGFANLLDELVGRYFGRCLDCNADNQLLPQIVRCLVQGTPPICFSQMGPVVLRILMAEEEIPPCVFKELILNQSKVFEDHPCLEVVDNELKDNFSSFSDFEVICCDHIRKLSFEDIDILSIKSSDDPLFKIFVKALQICTTFTVTEEERFGLQFISSIAFVSQVLSTIGKVVQQKPREWFAKGHLSLLFLKLNSLLTSSENNLTQRFTVDQLQRHLIKTVTKCLPSYDAFHKLATVFPSLSERGDIDCFNEKTMFNWLAYAENQDEIEKAVAEYFEQDSDASLTGILNNRTSFQPRISLVAVLTNLFLKVRCLRKIKDKEEQLANTITEKMGSLPSVLQSFIKKLVGIEMFHTDLLNWSQETDTETLTEGFLLHHLICILICPKFTTDSMSFMQRLLCKPGKLKNSFIPSCVINGNDTLFDIREQGPMKTEKTLRICLTCGFMFACEKAIDPKCCRCFSPTEGIINSAPCQINLCKVQDENIAKLITQSDNPFLTVRQLRPFAFRAINLLVHGCLLANIGCEFDPDNSVLQLLGVDSTTEAIQLCLFQFEENVKVLATSLNCSLEDICLRLHVVLIEGRTLLTELGTITSHGECLKWEDEMQELLMRVLLHKPLLTTDSFQFGLQRDHLVAQLLEIPCPNLNSYEETLMRLFRTTQQPTCASLSIFFFNMPNVSQKQYPFLAHVLANGDKLEYLKALYPMTEWAKFVRNSLEHKISREDLRMRKISDFFDDLVDKDNMKKWKKMYKKFEDAWNKCREITDVNIPRLNEQSPLSWCLVRNDDSPAYLKLLFVLLQEMQNKFLQDTLLIASAVTGPVAELLVDDSVAFLPLTDIENLRKSELIHFKWDDDYVKHSQSNTGYGKGRQIVYDLGKIEREFAVDLIPGKAVFLSPATGFRQMIFAKELFGEGGTVLKKIGEMLPQESLPAEVLKAIKTAHEHSSKYVRDLLADLELILCFLKKTGGSEDDSLVSYIEKWLKMLGRQLKNDILIQNQAVLCLKHIVALYEAVEDVTTNVNFLDDCYRYQMDKEYLEEFKSTKAADQSYPDEKLLTAVKRFISRYLMGDGNKLSVEESLGKCMADVTLWPGCKDTRDELVSRMATLIPAQVCLKHIHSFYNFIQDGIEERHAKEFSVMRDHARRQGRSQVTMMPRKTRRKQGFSRS